jgi:CubicO group peptidase (beta-lactamase class C family)
MMGRLSLQNDDDKWGNVNNQKTFQLICDRLGELMSTLMIPGVAVGIHYEGKDYTTGLGITSVDNPLPVTPDTLFQIGSITKTYVGTLAMRLVELGKLDLDTPIYHYLPDFRLQDELAARRVTMRHLLTHIGGWVGDYFDDFGRGDDALERMVQKVADLPQVTPLGTVWSYNNPAFCVAGRVIEVLTGLTFEQAVHDFILQPLGQSLSFFEEGKIMLHRFALGHEVVDGKSIIARPYPVPRASSATGGLVSTVNDQLRYARLHLGKANSYVLSRESLAQMHTPQVAVGGYIRAMGISWMLDSYAGYNVSHHAGGVNGQISQLLLIPEQDFALVILTNGGNGGLLTREGVKLALREFLGITLTLPNPITVEAERLADYVGAYTSYGRDITIRLEDQQLIAHAALKGGFPTPDSPPPPRQAPPMPLVFYAPDHFFVAEGAYQEMKGDFLRDDNGRVYAIRFSGRVHLRA